MINHHFRLLLVIGLFSIFGFQIIKADTWWISAFNVTDNWQNIYWNDPIYCNYTGQNVTYWGAFPKKTVVNANFDIGLQFYNNVFHNRDSFKEEKDIESAWSYTNTTPFGDLNGGTCSYSCEIFNKSVDENWGTGTGYDWKQGEANFTENFTIYTLEGNITALKTSSKFRVAGSVSDVYIDIYNWTSNEWFNMDSTSYGGSAFITYNFTIYPSGSGLEEKIIDTGTVIQDNYTINWDMNDFIEDGKPVMLRTRLDCSSCGEEGGSAIYMESLVNIKNNSFVENVNMDIGGDGDYEQLYENLDWSINFDYSVILKGDNRTELQDAIDGCTRWVDSSDYCMIPFIFTCSNFGATSIDGISLSFSWSPTNLYLRLNSSQSNMSIYQNQIANITAYTTTGDNLTFNLYNNTFGLMDTFYIGESSEFLINFTTSGRYDYILNTSGNINYSAKTKNFTINVWNITNLDYEQYSGTGQLTENNVYNVSTKLPINFYNPAEYSTTVFYEFNISSDFPEFLNTSVVDSTGTSHTFKEDSLGYFNWTSESVDSLGTDTMNLTFHCQNCLNYSSIIDSQNTTYYKKTLTFVKNITANFNTTIDSIKIQMPVTFLESDFDRSIKENGTEVDLSRVTVVTSGGYYDYLVIDDVLVDTSTEIVVTLTESTETTGLPEGVGGGGSGGEVTELGVYKIGNFSFLIDPSQVVTCEGLLCTNNRLTPYSPFNKFETKLRVCNFETKEDMILFPEWYWTCPNDNCIADWCEVEAGFDELYGIAPRSCGFYNINCVVPKDANTELNLTSKNPTANKYLGNFFVYPEGYSKNNAKVTSFIINIFSTPEQSILSSDIKTSSIVAGEWFWQVLNYKIVEFDEFEIFGYKIDGLTTLHIILISFVIFSIIIIGVLML